MKKNPKEISKWWSFSFFQNHDKSYKNKTVFQTNIWKSHKSDKISHLAESTSMERKWEQ